ELIHTEAADDGGEIGFERTNGLRRRGLVGQVGLLHHILSIHRAPQHAVGNGEEVGTIGFKGFHALLLTPSSPPSALRLSPTPGEGSRSVLSYCADCARRRAL